MYVIIIIVVQYHLMAMPERCDEEDLFHSWTALAFERIHYLIVRLCVVAVALLH